MIRTGFPLQAHVDRLLEAHATGADFEPLRHEGTPLTMDEAYAVQDGFVAAMVERRHSAIAGYKIGLTSAVMQQMCGIDRPIHGALFADGLHESGKHLRIDEYGRLCVEFEIAVKLADEPLPAAATLTRDSIVPFVEGVCPALEIVDDRNADYAALEAYSLTADNAWSAGAVLGELQPLPADLASRRGRVWCDGAPVADGLVGDVLGHPLEVVVWMARELAARGKGLPAGAVVMTGSIAKTQFARRGQHWKYEVEGLGSADMHC